MAMTSWNELWPTVIATVIGLSIIGVLGFIATAAVVWIRGRLGRRPDWVLEYKMGTWIIRRTKNRMAFDMSYMFTDQNNYTVTGAHPVNPDMDRGSELSVGDLKGMKTMAVTWIDKRRCSAWVDLEEGKKSYRITAERPPRRRLRFS